MAGETVRAGAKRKAGSQLGQITHTDGGDEDAAESQLNHITHADGGAEDGTWIASNGTKKTHIAPVEDKDSGKVDDFEEHEDEEDDDEYGSDADDDEDSEYEVEECPLTVKGPSLPRLLTLKLHIVKDEDSQQWLHTIHATCKHKGKIVARAHGQHINRNFIRASFYDDMEESTRDMSDLAVEIFDRYGCLKKELKDHPVRKGSGAWGSELDVGKLFFIEYIRVDPEWRRLGLATIVTEALMRKAQSHDGGVSFSLSIPGSLNNEIGSEQRGKSRKESFAIHYRHLKAAFAFWRSLGFRRVGASPCFSFATDSAHKAHKIISAEDYDPEEVSQNEVGDESDEDENKDGNPLTHEEWKRKDLKRMKKIRPVHHAIVTLPDAQCVDFFKACMTAKDATDPGWRKIDFAHDNVLHSAARLSKPQTVAWLMENLDKDKILRLARNLDGYTPLEALQAKLEVSRICKSDEFRGYSPDSIFCMGRLKEMSDISWIQARRLKYGCTCGECLMGFLSPRMRLVLLEQTQRIYFALSDGICEDYWCDFNEHHMDHVAPDLKQKFLTNRSLRQGFVLMFLHIATCLRQNITPTLANVLEECRAWSISCEKPVMLNFLAEGGNVIMALRKVFDNARRQDDKAGNGIILKMMDDDVFALPECRNDHEFGFVALACGHEDKLNLNFPLANLVN